MEHTLPRRTAGAPRTWSLCMTSENHGTVGPAGCKFSHAPEKHERVLVVELPTAAGAPADQINIRLVGARQDLPVAEFEGYVDGEPLVRWMDRDNMPCVGTKLFAAPVAAQAGQVAVPEDVIAKLDKVSRWIDKFPIPTTGATAMICHLRDVKEALAPSPAKGSK